MQWTQVFVGSALTATLVVGLGLAMAHWTIRPGLDHGVRHVHAGWESGRPGARVRGAWHASSRACGAETGAGMAAMLAAIEARLDLRPDQKPAWDRLRAAVDGGLGGVAAACPRAWDAATPADALIQAETMLAAGLTAVQDIRAAFDSFYATLSAGQQRALDRLILDHGHRGTT